MTAHYEPTEIARARAALGLDLGLTKAAHIALAHELLEDAMRRPPLDGQHPLCPACDEPMSYEPASAAEHDTGVGAWRGGFMCNGCGYCAEREEPDND